MSLLAATACDTTPQASPAARGAGTSAGLVLTALVTDSAISELNDLAIGGDGLWAAARQRGGVVRYAWGDGAPRIMVRAGPGPDEVRQVTSVAPWGVAGSVFWDTRAGRILAVRPDGTVEATAPRDWLTAPLTTRLWYYIGGMAGQAAAMRRGVLVGSSAQRLPNEQRFRDETVGWVDSAGLRPLLDRSAVARRIDSLTGHARELAPFPLWSPCGDAAVADYDPVLGLVSIVDLAGDTIRRISTDRDLPVLSDHDRRQYGVWQMLRTAAGRIPEGRLWAAMRSPGADSAIRAWSAVGPVYVDMICTAGQRVWLDRFELTDRNVGRSPAWDVYGGQAPVRVTFPRGFRLFDVNDTLGAGAMADSLGLVTISTFPVRPLLRSTAH